MKKYRKFAGMFLPVLLCLLGCDTGPSIEPVIIPIPDEQMSGLDEKTSLNGLWKFSAMPIETHWKTDTEFAHWADIQVPGEAVMQGFDIVQDVEYSYKKILEVPQSAQEKKLILRFDGVYSRARIWVDGHFLKQHDGGFTSWDVDITDHVRPGQKSVITIGVTDRSNDISRASFYAKHNIGGILRDVSLLILPKDHLTRLDYETLLAEDYKSARLNIDAAMHFSTVNRAQLNLRLIDPQNPHGYIAQSDIELVAGRDRADISMPILAPKLWDAEHPHLYKLEARLIISGKTEQYFERQVGFRDIKLSGKQMLINGKRVKLRGVNRHSLDPLLGRTDNPDLALADIKLFQEANINFIRTSHYPPTQDFLEIADKLGMYVEVETPVTWWNPVPDSTVYETEFMTQFAEMIARDRNHASVIMWSLGNESFWDPNFALQYKYAKQVDPSRPLIWSYAPPADQTMGRTEIYSSHYPELADAPLERKEPVLLDEYAHIVSYDYPTLQRDPNVRNFWGESLKAFWEKLSSGDGAIGGAIWSGVDEVFYAPHTVYGYGEWGLIDGWRRRKPEHWLTKKAYSPIRIRDAALINPGTGQDLTIPIQNGFDHTNLNEVDVDWAIETVSGRMKGPNIAPNQEGLLQLPAQEWKDGDTLSLRFYASGDKLVDAYDLPIGIRAHPQKTPSGIAPKVFEDAAVIIVSGRDFKLQFSKHKGALIEGRYKDKILITDGPRLALSPMPLAHWEPENAHFTQTEQDVIIHIRGRYGAVTASIDLHIDDNGLIIAKYSAENLPKNVSELGISFALVNDMDRLSWNRRALWSVYPDSHIGRPVGVARKFGAESDEDYREVRKGPWSQDQRNFALFGKDDTGRATRDFRALKAHVNHARIYSSASHKGITVFSNGTHAVRLGQVNIDCTVDDRDLAIIYKGEWSEYEDGVDCRNTEKFSHEKGATAMFRFYGDSVKWIGTTHYNMGNANVYIDGQRVEKDIDLYSKAKIAQKILFQKTDLPLGWHEIKIEVTGDKRDDATDTYVVIDGFHVSRKDSKWSDTVLNILTEWAYDPQWGNKKKETDLQSSHSDQVQFSFTDE